MPILSALSATYRVYCVLHILKHLPVHLYSPEYAHYTATIHTVHTSAIPFTIEKANETLGPHGKSQGSETQPSETRHRYALDALTVGEQHNIIENHGRDREHVGSFMKAWDPSS